MREQHGPISSLCAHIRRVTDRGMIGSRKLALRLESYNRVGSGGCCVFLAHASSINLDISTLSSGVRWGLFGGQAHNAAQHSLGGVSRRGLFFLWKAARPYPDRRSAPAPPRPRYLASTLSKPPEKKTATYPGACRKVRNVTSELPGFEGQRVKFGVKGKTVYTNGVGLDPKQRSGGSKSHGVVP
jgi:hypothetical protein